jgi:beta-aspartyl-peptidase (threonine type)
LLLSLPADEAARRAVRVLEARVRGLGGVILIDRHGHYGLAHNTPRMAFAYAEPEGQITAGIKRSPAHS